jgi:hypothetical protein
MPNSRMLPSVIGGPGGCLGLGGHGAILPEIVRGADGVDGFRQLIVAESQRLGFQRLPQTKT